MVFSSVIFLFWFLPIFLGLYLLAAPRYKNGLILGASALFYAWGAPVFVFVFLGTTLLDFHLVRAMHRASGESEASRVQFAAEGRVGHPGAHGRRGADDVDIRRQRGGLDMQAGSDRDRAEGVGAAQGECLLRCWCAPRARVARRRSSIARHLPLHRSIP